MYRPIGQKDILQTKIPSMGKYDDVGPTLNTGGNVLKVQPKSERKSAEEELFKRMRGSTLHRLLTDPSPEMKVVLLDVRQPEEYGVCHIMEASNYPHTMLSRSTNELTPQMFQNKNKEGVLMVCYDYDESLAPRVCNTLIRKGIENVVLLTGGLRKYCRESHSNIFGTPPPPSPTSSVASGASGRASSFRSTPSVVSGRSKPSSAPPAHRDDLSTRLANRPFR
eukprot:EG_transcript_25574